MLVKYSIMWLFQLTHLPIVRDTDGFYICTTRNILHGTNLCPYLDLFPKGRDIWVHAKHYLDYSIFLFLHPHGPECP